MDAPIAVNHEKIIMGYEYVMGGHYVPPLPQKKLDVDFQRGFETALFYIENQWTLLFDASTADILIWLYLANQNEPMLIPCEHRETFLALCRGTRKLILGGLNQSIDSTPSQLALAI